MAKMYVAKVNLISNIAELYKNNNCEIMKQNIMSAIKDKVEYIDKTVSKDGESDGFKYDLIVTYRTATEIYGRLVKKAKIYYKTLDAIPENVDINTDIYSYHSPEAAEEIVFLYDVFAEKIAFNTRQRFGYQQFVNGMAGIINKAVENANYDYEFELSLCTTSIDVRRLRESLKKIDNITDLEFRFQLPNPEEPILKKIQDNPEAYIEELSEAHIDDFSNVFRSKSGINLDSKPINNSVNIVENIHSSITGADALRNGYVKVYAINKSGVNYSSEEDGIFSRDIDEKVNYLNFCRETILMLQR